jgi:hypothetical protein
MMTTMTMMASQSTSDNRQIKRQQSYDTQQAKTIGGVGNNGDSGRKCYMNIYAALKLRIRET